MSRDSQPKRPNVMGTRHAIASGHYLASLAGFMILENGGNAVDAGVAAGLVLNVVESQSCGFGGVAPIMIYVGQSSALVTIDGLGTWPGQASCEYFSSRGMAIVPEGILQSVVPGAPASWLTALERYGTMSLGDVAASAIGLAKDGFPMYPEMAHTLRYKIEDFPPGTAAAAVFLPGGRPPEVGELFVQSDLARTLQFLVDEEAGANGSRAGRIAAAREAFYRGDIARSIVAFQRENGGLLRQEDLQEYHVTLEPPVRVGFDGIDVYSCGPWCQGPLLLQALAIIRSMDVRRWAHNSAEYVHVVTEVIKLCAADREVYYGDPKFVDVPLGELLSDDYARQRAAQISMETCWPGMPDAGRVRGVSRPMVALPASSGKPGTALDTSYVCVMDRYGNAFSATPSDGVIRKSPVVPGLGITVSPRGLQSRIDPSHPSSIAAGKRPRLTPNPSIVVKPGEFIMPFGTPGGDLQTQAMLQVFLNVFIFGMDLQSAIEAPRFYSYSFPDSFAPHTYLPGRLRLEPELDSTLANDLGKRGHAIERWPHEEWPRTSVCAVRTDLRDGRKTAAADHRRTAYALGW